MGRRAKLGTPPRSRLTHQSGGGDIGSAQGNWLVVHSPLPHNNSPITVVRLAAHLVEEMFCVCLLTPTCILFPIFCNFFVFSLAKFYRVHRLILEFSVLLSRVPGVTIEVVGKAYATLDISAMRATIELSRYNAHSIKYSNNISERGYFSSSTRFYFIHISYVDLKEIQIISKSSAVLFKKEIDSEAERSVPYKVGLVNQSAFYLEKCLSRYFVSKALRSNVIVRRLLRLAVLSFYGEKPL